MPPIFFDDLFALLRAAIQAVFAYAALVFFLRISGRRTLSKMNAFDLVVTVALGSTLATVILSKDVTVAEGALVFALLIGMQFAVTWSSVRVPWVRRAVTGEPALLVYQGEFLEAAMRKTRVTADEVRAAVRGAGTADLGAVGAVVLETDGSFSVIPRAPENRRSSLKGVTRPGSGG